MKTIVVGLEGWQPWTGAERAAMLRGSVRQQADRRRRRRGDSHSNPAEHNRRRWWHHRHQNKTQSRELLIEHTRKLLDARNLNYEIVSPVGDAGHKISAVADEHRADLIVVPAANASFLERCVHGQRQRQCRTQRPPRRPPRRGHRRGKLAHARHKVGRSLINAGPEARAARNLRSSDYGFVWRLFSGRPVGRPENMERPVVRRGSGGRAVLLAAEICGRPAA